MPDFATLPSADQTVGYLLHISETIGRVEGKLDTQNQVTRDLIARVDAHDTRLNAAEAHITGHEQRLGGIEQARTAEAQIKATDHQATQGYRRAVRLSLIGSGLMFGATALWKLWDAIGVHLLH